MKSRIIFVLAAVGIVAGIFAAYIFSRHAKPQPPVFQPVSSPYDQAIYANGIIESDQDGGSNVNIYPEVAGTVSKVLVTEGQNVKAGTPLLALDASVQLATTEQLKAQAEASLELLAALKAQPRKETLDVAKAQLELSEANVKLARDQYDKRKASHDIDPKSISKDVLDTALNTLKQAESAREVAQRQYDLTKAGTWIYDIHNQEKLAHAQQQAYLASRALLQKYTLRAQSDGVVMRVNASVGSYVSNQGSYDTYTQGMTPLIVMSREQGTLAVRCFVDEILVSKLPVPDHIKAEASIRGTDKKVQLEFVRVQPFVTPKIDLSNQRQEKVDLRVLPVIFRFATKDLPPLYPGQLVDVYIGQK